MSVLGLPANSVLVEARARYLPASDPADPHVWSIVIEDFDDAPSRRTGLKVTWSCARCSMGVIVEVRVLIEHVLASPGPMREKVVRQALVAAGDEGAKVHPRCSELRAAIQVMQS